jgi:hypothetical protein
VGRFAVIPFSPLKKQIMKKSLNNSILTVIFISLTLSFTSCATVLGGHISECQRTKPVAGQPSRQLRAGAMIADILLFWPGTIVDFATNAIYKPCDKK